MGGNAAAGDLERGQSSRAIGLTGAAAHRDAPVWSQSKITPPAAFGVIADLPRMMSSIDAAMSRPVVWVQGPPGAGKTTLVRSWVALRRRIPIWQRLDAEDSDPSTFFFYLGRAEALWSDDATVRLPLLTPVYQHGVGIFSRAYFRKLFDGPSAVTVVFDDYHELDVRSPVHECLAKGMEEIPALGRVVVISRSPPPREFAKLRVNGHVSLVEPETLRINAEEAGAIARVRGLSFDQARLGRLTEIAHGWIAGLILTMEASRSGVTIGPEMTGTLPELLFDYFATEVFQKFSEPERRALMSLAAMPTMTAANAQDLTGDPGAGALLERLARGSYFTVRDNETEPNYRFHPLFRQFLAFSAARTFDERDRKRIRLRAADILGAGGQPDTAAVLLHEGSDWPRLAELIKAWAAKLEASGRHRQLTTWLGLLPSEVVDADGWLCYWAAVARAPFAYAPSRPFYRRAFELLAQAGDVGGALMAGAGLLDAIAADHFADRAELDGVIALVRRYLERLPTFPSDLIEYRISVSMYAALGYRTNDRREIAFWRRRAFAAAERSGSFAAIGGAQVVAVVHCLVDGDFTNVREWIAAMPTPEACREAPDAQSLCYLGLIMAQSHRQAPGSVLDTAENALGDADRTGVRGYSFLCATYAAIEALRRGDAELARKWVKRIGESMSQISHRKGAFYYFPSCGAALLEGNFAEALRDGRRAIEIAQETNYRYIEGVSRTYLAQTFLEMDDLAGVAEQIDAIATVLRTSASGSLQFPFELLRAEYLFKTGCGEEGLAVLREALAAAELTGARRSYLMPPVSSRIFSRALAAGLYPDYVCTLIRNDAIEPGKERIAEWPWPLKIFTLGRFEALRDGKPIVHSRKTPKRLFTLLKAIVAFGGVDAPQSRVVDAVWPDEDGDAAARSFDTAIHRLRKLVGDARLIVLKDGKVGFNPAFCWIDAREFEAGLAQRDATEVELARTIQIYKGDFLAGDEELPWAEPMRRTLRAKFAKATGPFAR